MGYRFSSRTAAASMALALSALVLGGCTSAPAPHPGASPTLSHTPQATTYSPESITVVRVTRTQTNIVLEVEAPASTKFRIGESLATAIACQESILSQGDPTKFQVTCPAEPKGYKLIASVMDGDYSYSFDKDID